MKHSTSYNSPGSLSSPVVIAAAFPSAAGTSCSSSLHSLRPQRWSRSHRTTPHPPQRPPNVTSSNSIGLHANRTSARSLRGTQEKTIQKESSSNQGNSITVQPSHVQRRQKQQRQQPNYTTSVESEANVEEKAEDAMHDSVGVKATRKAKRRQTRRRRHTSPLQEKQQQQEEVVGQLPVIHSDKVLGEENKTVVTVPAAQKESKLIIVSSTTQASEKAHEQEEEETPPKRRQRRRRRAQQRQTRRQQSAKDIKVNPAVTATTPIVRKSSQGPEQKPVKDNGSNTTPTNATTTTTASSVASSCPHDQHKARSSRHEEADASHAIATATEKPKRVRRRRQRRQRPRREAVSSTQQQPQHPLLLVRERMEDNVASTPAVVEKDATEPSLALNQVASHNPPSALPTHLPVAALFSVPSAALRHSSQTTTSALNNVSRLTSAANEEEREVTSRRVGALSVFPSRPDLTQLTYNELSLFDSTTAAAFSLSSGTGGVRGGDEDGESTSPMTLATSCSPTSIHAPTSNGVHIPSVNMHNGTTIGNDEVEDEVGLRRRGLRVRAVAFQPRNSSGDEKDNNNNNTAGESTGASFGVRRRRGRRAVRPGAVLARHNYSVSDVDNVQHSCVAMSDVVAKDETLMFNMLVGNAEGDVDLVAGGDEVHMNDEAVAGNELNDDEDDDEEEEEVLMDLCGLRGAVSRTAPMPRHIAPGGGYWSEDNNNNNNSSSAVGGRSSYERSAYYYSMSYARAASRNSLTTSQSQVQPPHLHRQRSQPSLSYYETLTPQIAALLLPPAPNSASRDPSPTRTFRGTMSVMSTTEAMTDVDQWEMNSSVYEESLDEAQVQWIEEQLRASENPEGFFG